MNTGDSASRSLRELFLPLNSAGTMTGNALKPSQEVPPPISFYFFFTHRGLLCPSAAAPEKQRGRRHTAWCLNPQQTSVSLFFSLIIQRNPCSLLFSCSIPSLASVAYTRRVLPLPVSEL